MRPAGTHDLPVSEFDPAVDDIPDGGTIWIRPGRYPARRRTYNKPMTLRAPSGDAVLTGPGEAGPLVPTVTPTATIGLVSSPTPTEQATGTPTPSTSPAPPTAISLPPTPTPGVPTATPVPIVICAGVTSRVPPGVIADRLAHPETLNGWGQRCNPNQPPGPTNGLRLSLTLQNPNQAYHPLFNSLLLSCGCR